VNSIICNYGHLSWRTTRALFGSLSCALRNDWSWLCGWNSL